MNQWPTKETKKDLRQQLSTKEARIRVLEDQLKRAQYELDLMRGANAEDEFEEAHERTAPSREEAEINLLRVKLEAKEILIEELKAKGMELRQRVKELEDKIGDEESDEGALASRLNRIEANIRFLFNYTEKANWRIDRLDDRTGALSALLEMRVGRSNG